MPENPMGGKYIVPLGMSYVFREAISLCKSQSVMVIIASSHNIVCEPHDTIGSISVYVDNENKNDLPIVI